MKVMLVGASGYLGSAILEKFSKQLQITNVDSKIDGVRYQDLDSRSIESCEAVIWVAGHSSVRAAQSDPVGALRNNLVDLFEFGSKLTPAQILIYMSSASVYHQSSDFSKIAVEADTLGHPLNIYDATKMWFDELRNEISAVSYGLRLGTVNGYAAAMRTDLIINQMTLSAINNGVVGISNHSARRSILGIGDFCSAVEALLKKRPEPGIYNVASESATIGEIGSRVAQLFSAEITNMPPSQTYDFVISTEKLETLTDWSPLENVETIALSVSERK